MSPWPATRPCRSGASFSAPGRPGTRSRRAERLARFSPFYGERGQRRGRALCLDRSPQRAGQITCGHASGRPLEHNCFGPLTSERKVPETQPHPPPHSPGHARLLTPHLKCRPESAAGQGVCRPGFQPYLSMTRNKSPAICSSVCSSAEWSGTALNDVMCKVPSTGLAHTGSSVDTSFVLPDPDPATDLLCGLEQFHLTSVWGSHFPIFWRQNCPSSLYVLRART